MVFLKSLLFLLYNLGWGFLIPFSIKSILFFPSSKWTISGKDVPLTPGLIYRKKIWLINRMHGLLDDYLNACRSSDRNTKVAQWEQKTFDKAWDVLEFFDRLVLIPRVIRDWLRHFFAMIAYELVKQFLRTFIPYLMERYKVRSYIQLADQKLDVDILKGYYNRYIYKFMLIFFLGLNFLIGLGNMIVYLIIR